MFPFLRNSNEMKCDITRTLFTNLRIIVRLSRCAIRGNIKRDGSRTRKEKYELSRIWKPRFNVSGSFVNRIGE